MIRAAVVLMAACSLSGCAGIATYSVKPFYDDASKKVICCEALITNGKDIAVVNVDITRTDDTYTIHFQESGVGATAPVTAQGAVVSNVATAISNTAISAAKFIPK